MRLMALIATLTVFSGLAQAGELNRRYDGGQTGGVNPASGPTSVAGDGLARYGVLASHDINFGGLVLGGVIETSQPDLMPTAQSVPIGNVGRLKIRAGREFGPESNPGLAYAIVGGINGNTSQGQETGVVYGLGLSTAVGDHLRLSGEALRLVFDDYAGSGTDLQNDSFSVRVSFRF